jgi:uncharacterized membrane protein YidH (DUF202 family)
MEHKQENHTKKGKTEMIRQWKKKRGHGKLFPQRDYGRYYSRIRFDKHKADRISKSKYPTFILWLVRLFGFLTFGLFLATQKVYPCGGRKISQEEHRRRVKILAAFSMIISILLIIAGYCGLSLMLRHSPYKNLSQGVLLFLCFFFFLGAFGMAELFGLQSAYDRNGFLKRSPVNVILECRDARKNRSKLSKIAK